MVDKKSVENVCVFLVNENKYICEKMNISTIAPCNIFNDKSCSAIRMQFCQNLKMQYAKILLNGFINNMREVDNYANEFFKTCFSNERVISVCSDFGVFDSFGKHKYFENDLKKLMGTDAYIFLEAGFNRYNSKHIRICLVGFYLIHNMKLKDMSNTAKYDVMYNSFLKIFVPGFDFTNESEMNIFWNEFENAKFGRFDKQYYTSDLGKFVCDTINHYINILKDEVKTVNISSDIVKYIKERKSDIKDSECHDEEDYYENLKKAQHEEKSP